LIPITSIQFTADEEREILETLRTGQVAQGPKVKRFEEEFAAMHGVKHAVAVNNGTTALTAAFRALEVGPGDEVITTPFTFVATLNSILETGATARFADIREDDFNLDPGSAAAAVTTKSRIVVPVHLYGQMADMDGIQSLAERHHLRILEDAAQAHGASFRGRRAGSYGVGTFSLYATKNITTGEGGVVTTNDDVVADRLRLLRNQGMRERYVYEIPGSNYRLTDLQAAIGLPQLARYAATVERRKRNAEILIEGLESAPGIVTPRELEGRSHVWHQFTIRVTEEARVSRDELVRELATEGIGAGVYYPKLLWDYSAYQSHPQVIKADAPVARRVASQVVSLPVHNALSDDDLSAIITAVRRVTGA
jgi:dTDP-4-amino-4,6-dideoxygalactose transaminase